MDSPLLPTIRGSNTTRDFDQSLGDLTLASDGSPAPTRQQSQSSRQAPTRGVLFNRPAPTRNIDETPEGQQRVMSRNLDSAVASGSGSSAGSATRSTKPRFSLFAPPTTTSGSSSSLSGKSSASRPEAMEEEDELRTEDDDAEDEDEEEAEGDQTIIAGQEEQTAESRAARDERLKDSLYELRSINDTFEIFLGALESARGHNQRLAARVKETSTLLDQYTALLGQTEHTYKLLSNPNWTGGDDDIRALEAERAAQEAAELEAVRKAQEAERAAEEERERQAEAARAREAAAAATRGTVRGRGVPGTRGGTTRGRGSGIPAPTQRTVSGGKAPPAVRKAPSGLGLAGQYANVKSSGYGPSRKAT